MHSKKAICDKLKLKDFSPTPCSVLIRGNISPLPAHSHHHLHQDMKYENLAHLFALRYLHCCVEVLCTGIWYCSKNLILSRIFLQHGWWITMETLHLPRKTWEFLFGKNCKNYLECFIKENLWHKEAHQNIGNQCKFGKHKLMPAWGSRRHSHIE